MSASSNDRVTSKSQSRFWLGLALVASVGLVGVALLSALLLKKDSYSEAQVQEITLLAELASPNNEFSGLVWYGDTLILLPQYPDDFLYTIDKDAILAAIDGDSSPIEADSMPFSLSDDLNIGGFEGYEAIAIVGDKVYLSIEANNRGQMASYIVSGTISDDGIVLDTNSLTAIPQPANVDNKGHEALLMLGDEPIAIYEWNHYADDAKESFAIRFSSDLSSSTSISLAAIPYRVTDASTIDENGHFWMIDYLFPGDGAREADYPFDRVMWGTHANYEHVESLIELQVVDDEIVLLDKAPIFLTLEEEARNWEGLVRLEERNGFLLVTDKYPTTILAFVNNPQ